MHLNFRIVPYRPRTSWLLYPQPFLAGSSRAFFIEFTSESEALKTAEALLARKLPLPVVTPAAYHPDTRFHTDGTTRVFKLKE